MIHRFATVDLVSSTVIDVVDCSAPVLACTMTDERIGKPRVTYREMTFNDAVRRNGYAVYDVPPGFELPDGQQYRAMAALVQSWPFVGFFVAA